MHAFEANFDGLVGPTHNYAGLSYGNVASTGNGQRAANPRLAARQGLDKMKALADLGFRQGVLAPHERPDVASLRQLGFAGSDAQVIARAAREAPAVLAACSSASPMWTANAATVSPSADSADGRVHFTPANLNNKFHRAIEHPTTGRVLAATFADPRCFAHHPALPAHMAFGDEGAANHTRLCADYGAPGVQLFVYGQRAFDASANGPRRYPARQTLEASQAVARQHGLNPARVVFAQQAPAAIDAGVFHNDVIAVGNRDVLFYHQHAFADADATLAALADAMQGVGACARCKCRRRRSASKTPCAVICSTASCSAAPTAACSWSCRKNAATSSRCGPICKTYWPAKARLPKCGCLTSSNPCKTAAAQPACACAWR